MASRCTPQNRKSIFTQRNYFAVFFVWLFTSMGLVTKVHSLEAPNAKPNTRNSNAREPQTTKDASKHSIVALPSGVPAIQFETTQIEIISKDKKNKKKITVELASTPDQQQRGLMYRTKMAEDVGMLFEFPNERQLAFWMKNTYIPLDIAYINHQFVIVDIQQMQPASALLKDEPPSYPSAKPAKYALEMNQGWFKKNRFKVGDQIKILK